MKNLVIVFALTISMGLLSTSCTKTGCPSVSNYDKPLNKDLKLEAVAKLSSDDLADLN